MDFEESIVWSVFIQTIYFNTKLIYFITIILILINILYTRWYI